MSDNREPAVVVTESGNGPYGQVVTMGRHVAGADEPEWLGGRDTGPSPYQYLLAGLGACTAMTLRMYATRHAWPLEKVTVVLNHEKVPNPAGDGKVDRFERVITLLGGLSAEQRQRLLEIAETCPIGRTLGRPSLLVTRLAEPVPAA